jgi:hypothetical protein
VDRLGFSLCIGIYGKLSTSAGESRVKKLLCWSKKRKNFYVKINYGAILVTFIQAAHFLRSIKIINKIMNLGLSPRLLHNVIHKIGVELSDLYTGDKLALLFLPLTRISPCLADVTIALCGNCKNLDGIDLPTTTQHATLQR